MQPPKKYKSKGLKWVSRYLKTNDKSTAWGEDKARSIWRHEYVSQNAGDFLNLRPTNQTQRLCPHFQFFVCLFAFLLAFCFYLFLLVFVGFHMFQLLCFKWLLWTNIKPGQYSSLFGRMKQEYCKFRDILSNDVKVSLDCLEKSCLEVQSEIQGQSHNSVL